MPSRMASRWRVPPPEAVQACTRSLHRSSHRSHSLRRNRNLSWTSQSASSLSSGLLVVVVVAGADVEPALEIAAGCAVTGRPAPEHGIGAAAGWVNRVVEDHRTVHRVLP